MELDKVKIGDKFFGIIYKYKSSFMKGIKIVECEVVKINPKTIGIVFNKETRKYPQLMKKDKDFDVLNTDKIKLAKDYMSFLETSKFPEYLKKIIRNYCKRKLREEGK